MRYQVLFLALILFIISAITVHADDPADWVDWQSIGRPTPWYTLQWPLQSNYQSIALSGDSTGNSSCLAKSTYGCTYIVGAGTLGLGMYDNTKRVIFMGTEESLSPDGYDSVCNYLGGGSCDGSAANIISTFAFGQTIEQQSPYSNGYVSTSYHVIGSMLYWGAPPANNQAKSSDVAMFLNTNTRVGIGIVHNVGPVAGGAAGVTTPKTNMAIQFQAGGSGYHTGYIVHPNVTKWRAYSPETNISFWIQHAMFISATTNPPRNPAPDDIGAVVYTKNKDGCPQAVGMIIGYNFGTKDWVAIPIANQLADPQIAATGLTFQVIGTCVPKKAGTLFANNPNVVNRAPDGSYLTDTTTAAMATADMWNANDVAPNAAAIEGPIDAMNSYFGSQGSMSAPVQNIPGFDSATVVLNPAVQPPSTVWPIMNLEVQINDLSNPTSIQAAANAAAPATWGGLPVVLNFESEQL